MCLLGAAVCKASRKPPVVQEVLRASRSWDRLTSTGQSVVVKVDLIPRQELAERGGGDRGTGGPSCLYGIGPSRLLAMEMGVAPHG